MPRNLTVDFAHRVLRQFCDWNPAKIPAHASRNQFATEGLNRYTEVCVCMPNQAQFLLAAHSYSITLIQDPGPTAVRGHVEMRSNAEPDIRKLPHAAQEAM